MYQVIDLGALANDSAVNCSTVDTGVIADFYIILQHYITGLQHLAVLAVLGNIAKAVAADYRTGLQNNSVTQYTVLTDSGIRINGTILAHFYALADISMRIDYAAVADFGIILNNSKGLNSNIAADFCLLGYISIRTDNTLNLFLRTEQLQQCGKAARGLATLITGRPSSSGSSGLRTITPALLRWQCSTCGGTAKEISFEPASTSPLTPVMRNSGLSCSTVPLKIQLILVHSSPFHTSTIKPLTQKADGLSARFRVLLISFCNYVTGNIGTALRNGTLV